MYGFTDRGEAGRYLGRLLLGHVSYPMVVAAIPRGGVAVGAEIARTLGAPLTVVYTRNLTVPSWPEFAFGAIDDDGRELLDTEAAEAWGLEHDAIEGARHRVYESMRRRMKLYHAPRLGAYLPGRSVVIVDEGIATGMTIRAAIQYARRHGATDVTVAAPCASSQSLQSIMMEVDRLVVPVRDPNFTSVSHYYTSFPDVSEEAVAALLANANEPALPLIGNPDPLPT